jgi:hypothetical protein
MDEGHRRTGDEGHGDGQSYGFSHFLLSVKTRSQEQQQKNKKKEQRKT